MLLPPAYLHAHPEGPGQPFQILDNFNDVPGTPISNHTPDIDVVGGGWISSGGGTYHEIFEGDKIRNAAADGSWSNIDFGASEKSIVFNFSGSPFTTATTVFYGSADAPYNDPNNSCYGALFPTNPERLFLWERIDKTVYERRVTNLSGLVKSSNRIYEFTILVGATSMSCDFKDTVTEQTWNASYSSFAETSTAPTVFGIRTTNQAGRIHDVSVTVP